LPSGSDVAVTVEKSLWLRVSELGECGDEREGEEKKESRE